MWGKEGLINKDYLMSDAHSVIEKMQDRDMRSQEVGFGGIATVEQ